MAAPHKRLRLDAQEDYFSQLPRDCHHSIFRFLNSKALDELECVSRQIKEAVERRSLIGNKKAGSLTISEIAIDFGRCSLHEIIFAIDKSEICLCFRIFRGERDGKRTIETEQNVRSRETRSCPDGATLVPSAMFDNLCKLAKKHAINNCTLNRIPVEWQFLDQFLPLLSENSMNTLHFRDVTYGKKFDMKKFSEFILAANLQCLRIEHYNTVSPAKKAGFLGIFNEQFLSSFAAKCVGHSPSLELDIFQGMKRIPFHWTPSKEFLPVLSRFDNLSIKTMKVLPEHFIELILMRLNTVGQKKIKWYFSLAGEVTNENLKKIDKTKYTCNVHHHVADSDCDCNLDERNWRVIKKIGTTKSCRFTRCLFEGEWRVELKFVEKYRIPKIRRN